jgi:hypothetical protein
MPHACATPNKASQGAVEAPDPVPATPVRDPTHICETGAQVTLCYRPAVAIASADLTHCHPKDHGETCQTCQDNCHHAHRNLPF